MKRINTYEIALVLFVLISLLIVHSVTAQGTQLQRRICLELSDPETTAICLTAVGNSLGAIGDLKEAEQAFRDAIRISPDSKFATHAYSSLGGILGRQEKYDEAIVAFQSALAINPILGSAWSDLGVVYARIGRIDEAIRAYKQSISVTIIPEIIDDAYLNLTFLYLQKNDATNTKQTYQILYKRNPELAAKLLAELKGGSKLAERFLRFIKDVDMETQKFLMPDMVKLESFPGWEKIPKEIVNFIEERLKNSSQRKLLVEVFPAELISKGLEIDKQFGIGIDLDIQATGIVQYLNSYVNKAMSELNFSSRSELKESPIRKELIKGRNVLLLANSIKPDYSPTWFGLARHYYLSGECDRAIEWAKKAMKFDPLKEYSEEARAALKKHMGGDIVKTTEEQKEGMKIIIRDCS